MPAAPPEPRPGVALILGGVGGWVDAVGFLTLFGLFTAHLSGNTARFGVEVGQGAISTAPTYAVPIVVFFTGVVAGVWYQAAHPDRNTLPALLAVEAVLVTVFMVLGTVLHHGGDLTPRSLSYYGLAVAADRRDGAAVGVAAPVCATSRSTPPSSRGWSPCSPWRSSARCATSRTAPRQGAHPRQPRRGVHRGCGERLRAGDAVAVLVARDPGRRARGAGGRHAATVRDRARRGEAALPEDPAALTLGAAAPHAVVDAELERVLEALRLDRGTRRTPDGPARRRPRPTGRTRPGRPRGSAACSIHAGV